MLALVELYVSKSLNLTICRLCDVHCHCSSPYPSGNVIDKNYSGY